MRPTSLSSIVLPGTSCRRAGPCRFDRRVTTRQTGSYFFKIMLSPSLNLGESFSPMSRSSGVQSVLPLPPHDFSRRPLTSSSPRNTSAGFSYSTTVSFNRPKVPETVKRFQEGFVILDVRANFLIKGLVLECHKATVRTIVRRTIILQLPYIRIG